MSDSASTPNLPGTRARELGTLKIKSERTGRTHTIVLTGELDIAGAPGLDGELQRVESTDAAAIVLDLSQLEFIDSTGLRVLVSAHQRASADSNRLSLVPPTGHAIRVLEITGLIDILPFEDGAGPAS